MTMSPLPPPESAGPVQAGRKLSAEELTDRLWKSGNLQLRDWERAAAVKQIADSHRALQAELADTRLDLDLARAREMDACDDLAQAEHERDELVKRLERADKALQEAESEATNGITANAQYIDQCVSVARVETRQALARLTGERP